VHAALPSRPASPSRTGERMEVSVLTAMSSRAESGLDCHTEYVSRSKPDVSRPNTVGVVRPKFSRSKLADGIGIEEARAVSHPGVVDAPKGVIPQARDCSRHKSERLCCSAAFVG
jgi:hypothetical protein